MQTSEQLAAEQEKLMCSSDMGLLS